MPIPQNQLNELNALLQGEDKGVAELKRVQADISSELSAHDVVLQLGRDSKLLAALGEVHDNPALADQIAHDPQGFARSRGINLPPGATITASRPTSTSALVSAAFKIGRFQFALQYDKDKGFSCH